jgi:hypothetical protein
MMDLKENLLGRCLVVRCLRSGGVEGHPFVPSPGKKVLKKYLAVIIKRQHFGLTVGKYKVPPQIINLIDHVLFE